MNKKVKEIYRASEIIDSTNVGVYTMFIGDRRYDSDEPDRLKCTVKDDKLTINHDNNVVTVDIDKISNVFCSSGSSFISGLENCTKVSIFVNGGEDIDITFWY